MYFNLLRMKKAVFGALIEGDYKKADRELQDALNSNFEDCVNAEDCLSAFKKVHGEFEEFYTDEQYAVYEYLLDIVNKAEAIKKALEDFEQAFDNIEEALDIIEEAMVVMVEAEA